MRHRHSRLRQDLSGRRVGRLEVLWPATSAIQKDLWTCKCECGRRKDVPERSIVLGTAKSCGCVANATTHGHSSKREFRIWRLMLRRCVNPRDKAFRHYGGRGIRVCERWRDFENFFADMGTAPDGLTLDRKHNDGNYEPGNCRWATWSVQRCNSRQLSYRVLVGDRVLTTRELAAELGVTTQTIRNRILNGTCVGTANQALSPC